MLSLRKTLRTAGVCDCRSERIAGPVLIGGIAYGLFQLEAKRQPRWPQMRSSLFFRDGK